MERGNQTVRNERTEGRMNMESINVKMEENYFGADKIKNYGWVVKDNPGELMYVEKHLLNIDHEYQRTLNIAKSRDLASAWSWIACGVIVVGVRDGAYYVIDGQHRVSAALRRSDIKTLPCIVFSTSGIHGEARGFLDANTNRKPMQSIEKFRAMLVAGDDTAEFVSDVLKNNGVSLVNRAQHPKELKSVTALLRMANADRDRFLRVMRAAAALSTEMYIAERVLLGLWYIDSRVSGGILQGRIYKRLLQIGDRRLNEAACRAAAFYTRGGERVFASGMVEEMNKNLREKITLQGE